MSEPLKYDQIPFNVTELDIFDYGVPRNRITQIQGPAGTGKTHLALRAAQSVVAKGESVLYVDWNHELQPSQLETMGLLCDRFIVVQPQSLEEGLAVVLQIKDQPELGLVVLDGYTDPPAWGDAHGKPRGLESLPSASARYSLWRDFFSKVGSQERRTQVTVLGIANLKPKIGGHYGAPLENETCKLWKFNPIRRLELARPSVPGGPFSMKIIKDLASARQGEVLQFHLQAPKPLPETSSPRAGLVGTLIKGAVKHALPVGDKALVLTEG